MFIFALLQCPELDIRIRWTADILFEQTQQADQTAEIVNNGRQFGDKEEEG